MTLGDIEDRARGILNEASPNAWPSTDMALLGFAATGLQETHARMKRKLNGGLPNPSSLYWKYFFVDGAITINAGAQEAVWPATMDFLESLVDDITDTPMSQYDFKNEHILKRGRKMGVSAAGGFYSYAPNGKIRVLVWPGGEGVPTVNRILNARFYKLMPRYTSRADTIILIDEFTDPAVNFAVAKGLARFRESPVEFYQAFEQGIENML